MCLFVRLFFFFFFHVLKMKRGRSSLSLEESVATLASHLAASGTPKRREADRKYLKMPTTLQNYGVPVPEVTSITKVCLCGYFFVCFSFK
jgi:hypothetical protein